MHFSVNNLQKKIQHQTLHHLYYKKFFKKKSDRNQNFDFESSEVSPFLIFLNQLHLHLVYHQNDVLGGDRGEGGGRAYKKIIFSNSDSFVLCTENEKKNQKIFFKKMLQSDWIRKNKIKK